MERILNAKERNQAFLQFLIFFLVTVSLIVVAFYFDMKGVPVEENRMLDEQIKKQSLMNSREKEFVDKMMETKLFLDSIIRMNTSRTLVDKQFEDSWGDLTNMKKNDSSSFGTMSKVIVNSFEQMQKQKNTIVDQAGQISQLRKQLEDCSKANQAAAVPDIR